MTRDEARILARERLGDRRYKHTLGVEKACIDLAERYGADIETAGLTGLLHDICKELPTEDLLQWVDGSGIILGDNAMKYRPVLHAFAGGLYVKRELGLTDEISDAVMYHTTGRAGMSLMEKIVFLGDLISEERDFVGVDKLRALAQESLDRACLAALGINIKHIVDKGFYIIGYTIDAYNWFINITR